MASERDTSAMAEAGVAVEPKESSPVIRSAVIVLVGTFFLSPCSPFF
jgi:hypothetical protein